MHGSPSGTIGAIKPGDMSGTPPKRHESGRICPCGTKMSIYTPGEWCYLCQSNEARREQFADNPSEKYMLGLKSKNEIAIDVRTYTTREVAEFLQDIGIKPTKDNGHVKKLADDGDFTLVRKGRSGVTALYNADEVDAYLAMIAPHADQREADTADEASVQKQGAWMDVTEAAQVLGLPVDVVDAILASSPLAVVQTNPNGVRFVTRAFIEGVREGIDSVMSPAPVTSIDQTPVPTQHDEEIVAIHAVHDLLSKLSTEGRRRAVYYLINRLGIRI